MKYLHILGDCLQQAEPAAYVGVTLALATVAVTGDMAPRPPHCQPVQVLGHFSIIQDIN